MRRDARCYPARPMAAENSMKRLAGIAPLLLAAVGCGGTINYDYSKEPDPRRGEYLIGPSDRLKIMVWKYNDFSTETSVRPDGTITLPLIGDIQVNGSTPSQIKKEVQARLGNYVKDESAVVTVAVTDANSYRFTIAGNVEHPGIFASKYYMTVVEAISLAGGMNKFAGSRLVITRHGKQGELRRIPIDYSLISEGDHQEQNIVLLPGDTVFVP